MTKFDTWQKLTSRWTNNFIFSTNYVLTYSTMFRKQKCSQRCTHKEFIMFVFDRPNVYPNYESFYLQEALPFQRIYPAEILFHEFTHCFRCWFVFSITSSRTFVSNKFSRNSCVRDKINSKRLFFFWRIGYRSLIRTISIIFIKKISLY